MPGSIVETYVFLGALFFFALLETFGPLRPLKMSTPLRWLNHGVLLVLGAALNIILFRGGAVVFANLVATGGYGLFHRIAIPYLLRVAIGFAGVDLVHYASHVAYHRVPWLWRIHRVHHADPDYDVTTGLRFHPLEAILTQGSIFALIALLGLPAFAVLAAEIATVFQDIFEHANIELPLSLDRFLRWFMITPNIHRVHHSVEMAQQDRNFGTILPWWDRLFGTYTAASFSNDQTGLAGYPERESASVVRTLAMPFTGSSESS